MKRLGKYSGKIYEGDEIKTMEECGICITDEEAADKEFINNHHLKDLIECIGCTACPLSRRGMNCD